MRPQHPACALVSLLESAKTPSGSQGVFPHPPEAFPGVEVMATMGWQAREAPRAARVGTWRVELVRPVDPALIDDHHHLLRGFLEGCPHGSEFRCTLKYCNFSTLYF